MEFYIRHVTKITGVKRLRLHQWIERGYIKPSIQHGQKSGTPNLFSKEDLYRIELFKRLVGNGFSRELASSFVTFFTHKDPFTLAENVFSTDIQYLWLIFFRENGIIKNVETIVQGINEKSLIAEFQDPNVDDIFLINIAKIMKEVDEKIAKIDITD